MKPKIFFLSFLISLPFWLAVNSLQKNVENYFVDLDIGGSSKNLTASMESIFSSAVDFKQKAEEKKVRENPPQISAIAGIVIKISKDGNEEILYSKNIDESLPIASLSKLVTADVTIENYNNLSQKITISSEVADDAGLSPLFKNGESFSLQALLYSLLIESNNESAEAISTVIGRDALVELMNLEAKRIGASKTFFYNPSGRDPREKTEDIAKINTSTISDLVKIAKNIIENPIILEILQTKEKQVLTFDGKLHHTSLTTNKFLLEGDYINNNKIIFGKTGETKMAGQCLLLVLENEETKDYIISIVLNSDNRFDDTKKLLDWASEIIN